jgi:glycosyltransferase involved in cell wall biosynthesis
LSRIVTILPKGEGFSPQAFGAIALCVRDFTLHSRYRAETLVVGGTTPEGFDGLRYASPPRARWFENRTRAYACGCAQLIKREGATLAEIHNRPLLVRLIARHFSCKIALHLHNDPQEMREARTPVERTHLLALTKGVYCVSRYIRDRFLEGLPERAGEKVYVVPNGIEIPSALPPKENLIVFAGRMTEGKGALLLARALKIALPLMDGWSAVLIGSRRHEAGNPASAHEREIEETLAALGGQAYLPGFLPYPETLSYFARAAIAVVPSVWAEPFGRTALEAMAHGCALISSGTGALKEVTGNAAFTLSLLEPRTIADALLKLATDEQARTKLQDLARARAQAFAITGCAATLDDARDRIFVEGQRSAA